MIIPITFVVIIGTVVLYGFGSPFAARKLGVADALPQGILFVGADRWARATALFLQEKGFRVLLVDTNRENTTAARMAGLRSHTGSVLSAYVLDEIDLGGVGRLFAVTPNDWVNALAVHKFSPIFGRAACYQLSRGKGAAKKPELDKHLQGRWLFGAEVTYWTLQHGVSAGAVVKATKLSAEFDYASFSEYYGKAVIPMFILSEAGVLLAITADQTAKPQAGQTVISLVEEPKQEQEARQRAAETPADGGAG